MTSMLIKRSALIGLSSNVIVTRMPAGTWHHNEASVSETAWRVYRPSLRTAYIAPNTHLIIVLNSEHIEQVRVNALTHTRARACHLDVHAHTHTHPAPRISTCFKIRVRISLLNAALIRRAHSGGIRLRD